MEVVLEVDRVKGGNGGFLMGSGDVKRMLVTILRNSEEVRDLRVSSQSCLKDEENMKNVLDEMKMRNPGVNIDYRYNFL